MSLSTSSPLAAHRRGSGVPLLVLAGLAWGTGGLLGTLLGRETGLTPLAVAAYRLTLGGLLVLAAVAGLTLAAAGGVTSDGGRRLLAGPEHRRSALYRIGLLAVLAAALAYTAYFRGLSASTSPERVRCWPCWSR